MENKSIVIVGLGLIGGSLAKALKKNESYNIIGIDNNQDLIELAIKEKIIDKGFTQIDAEIAGADVVFVCTPINIIVNYVEKISEYVNEDCIIADTGSIKGRIVEEIENRTGVKNFIGGHPMCGSEKNGLNASKGHLFENAYFILTPCNNTAPRAVTIMEKIIIEIGAIPVIIDYRKHDFIAGAISHLPHIISASLVNIVKDMDQDEGYMRKLAAGGFKDITRISSSDPSMWEKVVLNNKERIDDLIKRFIETLQGFRGLIEDNDSEKICDYFKKAKEFRDTFPSDSVGLIKPYFDITVDIQDRPGEIGRIATLLGDNGINIKNINVMNNREHENGCLKVSLQDIESFKKTEEILISNGYMVFKNQ